MNKLTLEQLDELANREYRYWSRWHLTHLLGMARDSIRYREALSESCKCSPEPVAEVKKQFPHLDVKGCVACEALVDEEDNGLCRESGTKSVFAPYKMPERES